MPAGKRDLVYDVLALHLERGKMGASKCKPKSTLTSDLALAAYNQTFLPQGLSCLVFFFNVGQSSPSIPISPKYEQMTIEIKDCSTCMPSTLNGINNR